MSEVERDHLLDHSYDGITEYDNPLPSWWKGIFIASIVFSLGYWVYYHAGGPGLSIEEVYAEEMRVAAEQQAKAAAASGAVDEKTLAQLATNPSAIAEAKASFDVKCTPCHGMHAEGKIGPNLTDLYQIHGTKRVDIYRTIYDGVPSKGMISWGKQLKPEEIMKLAAYVSTLRGTNAAGGKAPEGEKVDAF